MSNSSDQLPLTPGQHEELADIDRFNAERLGEGWSLRNRHLEEEDLSGIRLERAALFQVKFEGVSLRQCEMRSSKLTDVEFPLSDLRGSVFERVAFVNCDFSLAKGERASFLDCTFEDCRGTDFEVSAALFNACRWIGGELESLKAQGARFLKSRFEGCRLSRCAFYDVELRATVFEDCRVSQAIFSRFTGGKLTFRGGVLAESGFDSAVFPDLAMESVAVEQVTFEGVELGLLRIVECASVESLAILSSRLERFHLADCADVTAFLVNETEIAELALVGASVSLFDILGSRITERFRLRGVRLLGVRWSDSRFRNAQLDGVEFERQLITERSVFEGLSTAAVRYDEDLQVKGAGARFLDSEPLGRP